MVDLTESDDHMKVLLTFHDGKIRKLYCAIGLRSRYTDSVYIFQEERTGVICSLHGSYIVIILVILIVNSGKSSERPVDISLVWYRIRKVEVTSFNHPVGFCIGNGEMYCTAS